jgi:hypothetical protein
LKIFGDLLEIFAFVVIFQNSERNFFADALRRSLVELKRGTTGRDPDEEQEQGTVGETSMLAVRGLATCDRAKRHSSCWFVSLDGLSIAGQVRPWRVAVNNLLDMFFGAALESQS